MKNIPVTKKEIETLFSSATTFGELLGLLENEFQKKGDVICRIVLNGIELTDDEEKSKASLGVSEVTSLNVVTAHPDDLMQDLLQFWTKRLPELETETRKTADMIRFDGIEASFTPFVKIVENCQELVRSLGPAKAILSCEEDFPREKWSEAENSLGKTLTELFTAFETKDFVLLSDLMEYDLGNSLGAWGGLVSDAKARVGNTSATGDSEEQRTESPRPVGG